MKRFVALTAIVLLSAGFASAGPIVPKDIGADAKWFGHVNCEAIRSIETRPGLEGQVPHPPAVPSQDGRTGEEAGDEPDGGHSGGHSLFQLVTTGRSASAWST